MQIYIIESTQKAQDTQYIYNVYLVLLIHEKTYEVGQNVSKYNDNFTNIVNY